MKRLLKRTSDFLASYKLSCVLFLLLLLLTYLGTMHQVEHGLYQSQLKYFESMFLVHWAFDAVPVPLPGGYLLMMLTFVNLFWGVVVRFRMTWSKLGMVVAHAGILLLLVGAFVSYVWSVSGNMILYEGESSGEIQSSQEWEISVAEASSSGPVMEHIIPQKDFDDLSGSRVRTFTFPGQPFRVRVGGFILNAAPVEGGGGGGPRLAALPPDREYQRNQPGVSLELTEPATNQTLQSALWAGSRGPVRFSADGKEWWIALRPRRWQLPFTIRLDRFVRELHPRTSMPSEFSSFVTKTEGDEERQIRITMNEPLRHHGFTFYQSSWGPQSAGPNDRLYSVFSVVKNPADQVPLYACIISTLGLAWHFLLKLAAYLRRERASKARRA